MLDVSADRFTPNQRSTILQALDDATAYARDVTSPTPTLVALEDMWAETQRQIAPILAATSWEAPATSPDVDAAFRNLTEYCHGIRRTLETRADRYGPQAQEEVHAALDAAHAYAASSALEVDAAAAYPATPTPKLAALDEIRAETKRQVTPILGCPSADRQASSARSSTYAGCPPRHQSWRLHSPRGAWMLLSLRTATGWKPSYAAK